MYTKKITYVDFNGQSRTETLYFNLTKAEWMSLQFTSSTEGLQSMLDRQDAYGIVSFMKELILSSYGVKSSDGRRFDKSPEIRKDFESTQAFSDFFMTLAYDYDAAADFLTHVVPSEMAAEADKIFKEKTNAANGNSSTIVEVSPTN